MNGSIAHTRNVTFVSFLSYGFLYEAANALDGLNRSGIRALVGDRNRAWGRLDKIRRRWTKSKDHLVKLARHKLAFHLGDADEIKAGLDRYPTGKKLVIFDSEHLGQRFETTFPFVLEVLFAGLAIDADEFTRTMTQATEDHLGLGRELQALFLDALRENGVKIPDSDDLRDGDDRRDDDPKRG